MKKKVIAGVFIAALMFFSCATTEGILVLNSVNGTNLFMRNTVIKTNNSSIPYVEFDITANVDKNELLEKPVVKYTFTVSKKDYSEGEKAELCFENEGNRYALNSKEYMFRSLNSKKDMNIRYSAEMEKEDFMKIMKSYDSVNLVLILSDGKEIVLRDKNLNSKINDMRLLVN